MFSIDTVSLDDWSPQNRIENVSVMKVDAEGSEVEHSAGARNFLQRAKPAIIIEANDVVLRQAHSSALELTGILRATVTNFLSSSVRPCGLSGTRILRDRANCWLCRWNEAKRFWRGSGSPDFRS